MDAALPPLGRMSLIAIWIETLFYGANVILFVTCLWVLLSRVHKINIPLLASTVLLFSMCSAHVALSLVQLLQGFTNPAITSQPSGTDMYFAIESDPVYSAKNMLYNFAVFSQDILLIWRLYMVWGRNWKVCIVPIIMECIHIGTILVAAVLLTMPSTNVFSTAVQAWGLTGWGMDVAVNSLVTFGIAYRLWLADREMASASSAGGYKTAMFTVLESGALFATATIVLFALDASGNVAGNVGISPVSQLAATTPMLIIARVGVLSTAKNHGDSSVSHSSFAARVSRPSMATRKIEVSIQRTEDVENVYPLKDVKAGMGSGPSSMEEGRAYRPSFSGNVVAPFLSS
ncbi:hypothetical protein HYDPIDRAFT_28231 [Hydnomerulius pinastri MD-312]|uniref:Uncharacterized protein n=1 Tax=Hydnomerulius pinastri MD-312 TaxID=994086 RepID=A0A0C9WG63_9AGAM|nr:hypothetical protein HYDPIDRAFT_28231 [Hydnomerulius pinastri MD-312]